MKRDRYQLAGCTEMGARRHLPLLIVVVACVFSIIVVGTGVANGKRDASTRLGRGHAGRDIWIATLQPSFAGREGQKGVCLSVTLGGPDSGNDYSEAFECKSVTRDEPLIESINESISAGGVHRERSVFAALFTPEARKAVVRFNKGRASQIQLRWVSKQKARQIGVQPIAYWIHGYAGPVCLKRITVYDGAGVVLSNSKLRCEKIEFHL
jgi:hypothetical protein